MDYHDALAALADRGRFGIRLGLGRTRAILARLGDPQHEVRGALVAGTNGKGSVVALAANALRAAGLHVGATPKPHLVSYRERIEVDGRPISPGDFADHVGAVLEAADKVERRHGPATEFELLTAVTFRHLAAARVDVAVVEVGLGGRLDATHAWDGGVAAITNVDLDHTEYLGSTIAEIAREKAAIIERGDHAVTGTTGAALQVVRRRARAVGAPLTVAPPAPIVGLDLDGITVDLPGLDAVRVGLRGRHQAANIAVADAVLDALAAAGIATVDPEARRRGYADVAWPGRLELLPVPGGGHVLLDGAHNPAGAATLAQALDDLMPLIRASSMGASSGALKADGPTPGRLTVIMGVMADKDVPAIVRALAGSTEVAGARIVATALADAPRSMPAAELAAIWRREAPAVGVISTEDDPIAALEQAIHAPRSGGGFGGLTVVAGSLYLVGAVRAHLVDDPDLRDPERAHQADPGARG
jgi:dihydrofolate synthase / folylpolyglutamate synthase